MKVVELLTEDWAMTINHFLKKIGVDVKFRGQKIELTKQQAEALADLCNTRRLMMPDVIIKEGIIEERLKWHDSDAPKAKGRFRDLSIDDLADWLIKTRGGDMQRINGALQQQITFNKNDDPAYARKMESVRKVVKRRLAAKKD